MGRESSEAASSWAKTRTALGANRNQSAALFAHDNSQTPDGDGGYTTGYVKITSRPVGLARLPLLVFFSFPFFLRGQKAVLLQHLGLPWRYPYDIRLTPGYDPFGMCDAPPEDLGDSRLGSQQTKSATWGENPFIPKLGGEKKQTKQEEEGESANMQESTPYIY